MPENYGEALDLEEEIRNLGLDHLWEILGAYKLQ